MCYGQPVSRDEWKTRVGPNAILVSREQKRALGRNDGMGKGWFYVAKAIQAVGLLITLNALLVSMFTGSGMGFLFAFSGVGILTFFAGWLMQR